MASRDQLKALIRSHFEQNEAQFMSVAMQVAASEARRAMASWPRSFGK